MDVRDRRLERAHQLLAERFHGVQAEFADAIERPPNYVSRMLSRGKNRKRIGEDLARDIEKKLGLEKGWFDKTDAPEPITDSAEPRFERRHIALLQFYLSLPDEQRFAVRMLIETLAGAQNPRLQKFMRQIEDHNHVRDRARPATTEPAPEPGGKKRRS